MVNYINKQKICKAQSCESSAFCRGLCNKHYQRMIYHGDYNLNTVMDERRAIIDGSVARIPLGLNAKDGYTTVDKINSKLDRYKWSLSLGYPVAKINGKLVKLHRLIASAEENHVIDHIDRDKTNNLLSNLRKVTNQENAMNRKIHKNNSLGYKGVYIKTSNVNKIYGACIGYSKCDKSKKKQWYLGAYSTVEEAALAYDVIAIQLYGEYAYTNIL